MTFQCLLCCWVIGLSGCDVRGDHLWFAPRPYESVEFFVKLSLPESVLPTTKQFSRKYYGSDPCLYLQVTLGFLKGKSQQITRMPLVILTYSTVVTTALKIERRNVFLSKSITWLFLSLVSMYSKFVSFTDLCKIYCPPLLILSSIKWRLPWLCR